MSKCRRGSFPFTHLPPLSVYPRVDPDTVFSSFFTLRFPIPVKGKPDLLGSSHSLTNISTTITIKRKQKSIRAKPLLDAAASYCDYEADQSP